MNHKLSAFSCQLLAILYFSIFNYVSAQTKSSLQVDSINIKKATATTLPIGTSSDSLVTVMNGEVRKIPMPASMISADEMKAQIACSIGIITDPRDGNIYTVKNYGTAGCWMTQNLRYFVEGARSNVNGVVDTLRTTATSRSTTITVAQMRNDSAVIANYSLGLSNTSRGITFYEYYNLHGVLYSWNQAMTTYNGATGAGTSPATAIPNNQNSTIQGVCPPGWFLPGEQDYNDLTAYLRTTYGVTAGNEGLIMKINGFIAGTVQGGNNISGWNGWLVGSIEGSGSPMFFGTHGVYWTSCNRSIRWLGVEGNALNYNSGYDATAVGMSVRCKRN